MSLVLKRGGALVYTYWNGDQQRDVEIDVSDCFLHHLLDECVLEEGAVLRDLLVLMRNQSDLYSHLLTHGPWLKEIVEEGLNPPITEDDDMTHLELHWVCEVGDGGELVEDVGFHGVGPTTTYGIEFSPVNSLADYPLVLNDEYRVFDRRDGDYKDTLGVFAATKPFKLIDVLLGVFYELSFTGGPKDRKEFSDSLRDSLDDVVKVNGVDGLMEELKKE